MRKFMMAGALAAVAMVAAPAAKAQATKSGSEAPVNDTLFAQAAAASGMAELEVSKIALKNGEAEARKHAQHMIDDHSKANQQLMALAASKRIELPKTVSFQDAAAADDLMGVTGEKFDKCYAKQQHAAHICAVALFTAEAERGQDPDLKAFAAKTLPTLKEHLKMFKDACEKHEKSEK